MNDVSEDNVRKARLNNQEICRAALRCAKDESQIIKYLKQQLNKDDRISKQKVYSGIWV